MAGVRGLAEGWMSLCSPNAHTRLGRGRRMIAPAQATVKPHDLSLAWLRKLDPSWASSERTFEQCVSPSPTATAATGSCTPRKSQEAIDRLLGEGTSELGRNFSGRCSSKRARWGNPPLAHLQTANEGKRGRMQSFDRQRRGNEADLARTYGRFLLTLDRLPWQRIYMPQTFLQSGQHAPP
jgi:hypothetical protein